MPGRKIKKDVIRRLDRRIQGKAYPVAVALGRPRYAMDHPVKPGGDDLCYISIAYRHGLRRKQAGAPAASGR